MLKKKFDVPNAIITVILGIIAIVTLFPFYQTVMLSFSTVIDAGSSKVFLYPSKFDVSAYYYLYVDGKVLKGLIISIIVTLAGTALSLAVSTAGAYALSKKSLPGRNLMFNAIIFTLFFSGGLIPYFLTVQKLHMQNSILVMIVPAAVNTFYLILMKNFFNTVPASLEESAKIDGANDIVVLIRIVIPVSMPILATMTLFYAVDKWNEWWLPTLFINDTKLYPLQLVLRNALTNLSGIIGNSAGLQLAESMRNVYSDSVRSAMIVVSAVPIILVYPFIQKHFSKGILVGSIKG